MTSAETGRFLIVCALASDLYCPTYISGAGLTKDSNLAKAVAHYRINGDKVLREIREGFAKKSPKPKNHSKPPLSATPKR